MYLITYSHFLKKISFITERVVIVTSCCVVKLEMFLEFLFFVTSIFLLAYLLVKKRYNYWSDRGFIQTNTVFPFGSFKGVGSTKTPIEILDVYYKQFKGKARFIGIYSFLTPSIALLDPEMFKHILLSDFSSFHDRGMYYNKKDDPTSAK